MLTPSATLLLLVGALGAVGVSATGGAEGALGSAERPPLVLAAVDTEVGFRNWRLTRLDPRTLQPLPGSIVLDGQGKPVVQPPLLLARSPSQKEALVATMTDSLSLPVGRVLDLQTMTAQRQFGSLGLYGAVTWPLAQALVMTSSWSSRRLDLGTGNETEIRVPWSSYFKAAATSSGVIVASDSALGSRVVVRGYGLSGLESAIPLDVWTGLESSRTRTRLAKRAQEAVIAVKAEVARRHSVSADRVSVVGVTPGTFAPWPPPPCGQPSNRFFDMSGGGTPVPGYALIAQVKGVRYDARLIVRSGVSSPPHLCGIATSEDLSRGRNLLTLRRPVWQARELALVARSATRAVLVSPAGLIVDVNLATRRVGYRLLDRPLSTGFLSFGISAVPIGRNKLAVATGDGRPSIVDLPTGRVREVGAAGCRSSVGAGLVLVYGTTTNCQGLVVLRSDGARRFRLFRGVNVDVQTAGSFAYVRRHEGAYPSPTRAIESVDLRTGEVVGRLIPDQPTHLLVSN